LFLTVTTKSGRKLARITGRIHHPFLSSFGGKSRGDIIVRNARDVPVLPELGVLYSLLGKSLRFNTRHSVVIVLETSGARFLP